MTSQRATVLRLLRERGEAGVGAQELIFQHGITRSAAIVHKLRTEDHLPIQTKPGGPGELAVYYLPRGEKVRPTPPPTPAQTGLLPDDEIPTVTWEELGDAFRAGRRTVRVDPRKGAH
jgi:hypothetical protein